MSRGEDDGGAKRGTDRKVSGPSGQNRDREGGDIYRCSIAGGADQGCKNIDSGVRFCKRTGPQAEVMDHGSSGSGG